MPSSSIADLLDIGGVDVELVEGNGDGRGEGKFRGGGRLCHGKVLLG